MLDGCLPVRQGAKGAKADAASEIIDSSGVERFNTVDERAPLIIGDFEKGAKEKTNEIQDVGKNISNFLAKEATIDPLAPEGGLRLNEQITISGTIVGFEDGLVQVKLPTGDIQSFERPHLVKAGMQVAFLPMKVNGEPVLTEEGPKQWRLTITSEARAKGMNGIGYKKTKNNQVPLGPGAKWGEVINGVDEGDGWLRCDLDFKELIAGPSGRQAGPPMAPMTCMNREKTSFGPHSGSFTPRSPVQQVDGHPQMLADAVAAGRPENVTALVQRIVVSLNGCIVDAQRAKEFGKNAFSKAEGMDCHSQEVTTIFNEMVFQIQRDLQTPGSWVVVSTSPYGGKYQTPDSLGDSGTWGRAQPSATGDSRRHMDEGI